MKETTGNLWEEDASAICITTNGFVKKNGAAVMGRGCAEQATRYCPGIEFSLGEFISNFGNHVFDLGKWRTWAPHDHLTRIYSFPVKHKWFEKGSLQLIERSAHELVEIVSTFGDERVVIPRPGCGNGQLRWEDVKPVIEPILDDRFVIITF